MRRPWYGSDQMFCTEFRDALFEREAALQRPRLVGCPGADLAAPRTRRVIGVGFLRCRFRDRPFEPHLAAQRLPMEQERGLGMRQQVQALPALIIGVENEASG